MIDKLKSVGVNHTWKILLDLDLPGPFRIANRSLDDILYPKETYSSKRPLPILQKTREITESAFLIQIIIPQPNQDVEERNNDVFSKLEDDSNLPFLEKAKDDISEKLKKKSISQELKEGSSMALRKQEAFVERRSQTAKMDDSS